MAEGKNEYETNKLTYKKMEVVIIEDGEEKAVN